MNAFQDFEDFFQLSPSHIYNEQVLDVDDWQMP